MNVFRATLLVVFAVLTPHPLHLAPDTVEADELLAGAAKLELTPPVHTPLAGYSRRKGKPATGSHDPLFVRAVVLRDGTATVALASCDLLIIDEALFAAVQQRLEAARPDVRMSLLVAATHTHSGPGAYGRKFLEKVSMGHFDPAVFEVVSTRITEAILTALDRLHPVTVRSAAGQTSGLVVNRMDPGGVVDPELAVLGFSDRQGTLVAAIVNFGAHATTLGAWNRQFSADYPGVVMQALEQRYPSAVCLFFAGAVADQAPVKQGSGFEPAQRLGAELANHAITLLESPSERRGSALRAAQRTVRLPPARLRLGTWRLPSWLSQGFADDDATLTLAAVDRTLFMGVPCDVSAELGLELKAHARRLDYQPVVAGFANDYIGYCLPQRLYWTDSYEARLAFNGPTTGPMLVEELKRMIDELAVVSGQ